MRQRLWPFGGGGGRISSIGPGQTLAAMHIDVMTQLDRRITCVVYVYNEKEHRSVLILWVFFVLFFFLSKDVAAVFALNQPIMKVVAMVFHPAKKTNAPLFRMTHSSKEDQTLSVYCGCGRKWSEPSTEAP